MTRDMLIRYIIALTNLYGIVHKKMVCEIYNQQNRDSVNIRKVEALLRNPPAELVKNFVVSHGDYFVNDSVFEFDEFDELLKQKENQPYYIPSQDELLKYEDSNYFDENEYYRELYKYIKNNFFNGDDNKTRMLAEDIQGFCGVESDLNSMMDEFSRRGLKFKNNSQREEAIRLIEDLAYNTRLWSNNGFTDNERQQYFEETIASIINNINIEQAVASQPIHDLKTILGFHSVSDLREIAKILDMPNTSKLKKLPLTIAMLAVYSRPDVIEYFLKYMHREAWNKFLAASKVDEYILDNPLPESYMPLQKLCLVQLYYYNEKLILVVPDEVKNTFAKLIDAGFVEKKQLMDDHVEFAKAAINLYGVIALDEYVNLFNRMRKNQTDKSQAYEFLKDFAEADIAFFFWNDYLVSNVYSPEEPDEISNMLQEQRGKPRYVPNFDEFILYSDDDYYEKTPQLEKLEGYLSQHIDDEDEIMEIIDMIHDLCMDGAMPTEHLDMLKMRGVEFENINTANEFLQVLADVINNTRIWENNGFTPNEIFNGPGRPKVLQFPTGKPVLQDKIGRNDHCPCGSGKKYKNCCGKLIK